MAELLGTINNSTDLEGVLGTFTEAIDEHVEPFVKQLGEDVVLGSYRPMFMTPESPNSARTMVPVLYKGLQVATLYVIRSYQVIVLVMKPMVIQLMKLLKFQNSLVKSLYLIQIMYREIKMVPVLKHGCRYFLLKMEKFSHIIIT